MLFQLFPLALNNNIQNMPNIPIDKNEKLQGKQTLDNPKIKQIIDSFNFKI